MHPANIAIVFAPNLLKPQSDDIATQITDTPYSNKLMELFVQQYHVIFKVRFFFLQFFFLSSIFSFLNQY